ncbi:hypothetical protein ACFY9Y_01700 [Streptomyces fimicarius]|uniref:hypothetical protein n=1 Tax=Streptomyces TaxID=1883 RepID=UPI0015E1AE5D|nr:MULTISPECIES: hypothetical protein [unclassified Streptomyces]MCL6287425.1 hypothetical protein [Streptomyces sp. 43Y-GA-1]
MNRSAMRFRTTVISTVVAGAVTFTGIGTAHAAEASGARDNGAAAQNTGVGSEPTAEQVDELARYLQALDNGDVLDSQGVFDYDKTRAEFGVEFADAIQAKLSGDIPVGAYGSYTSCLLKGVGLGGLGGATAAITAKLKKKHFTDAAKLIIKEAAKRGIKVGVKGGVAGLAASLGTYAVWCATPWA